MSLEKTGDILVPALKMLKNTGRERRITVAGGSMRPFLSDGSEVVVERGVAGAGAGDIVVFSRKSRLVVHRVVRVIKKGGKRLYLTKGDSALAPDYPPVSGDEIIGVVRGVVRGKRTVAINTRGRRLAGKIIALLSPAAGRLLAVLKGRSSAKEVLSGEDRFIFSLASLKVDEKHLEFARGLIEKGLDWEVIVNTSYDQGVAPLIYDSLKRTGLERYAPEKALERLKIIYYSTASINSRLITEAGKVIEGFNNAGIETLVFKGPSLVESIYKNPALRPFSDVDLLIGKRDLPRAITLMEGMGYVLSEKLLPMEVLTKYHFHLPFRKADDHRIIVEVHWDLKDNYKDPSLDIEGIWERARAEKISGAQALVMSPEDHLMYLCNHLDRHGYMNRFLHDREDALSFVLSDLSWNRLIWFTDIREFISSYGEGLDWRVFVERTRKWDKNGSVAASLKLTERLFGPDGLDGIATGSLNRPRTTLIERLLYGFVIKRSGGGKRDFLLRFYEERVIGGWKRFPFRPIRFMSMNLRSFGLILLFPLDLALHGTRKFLSRFSHE